MKNLILICVFVLLSLVFFGCTQEEQNNIQQQAYSVTHPCPKLPCYDANHFNAVLSNTLGLSMLDYKVECMECAFPYETIKGSYSKARLDFNGDKVEVYYKEGLCSSPGIDCGWEVCVSTEKDKNADLIAQVKEKFCPLLVSELSDLNSSSCKNEVLYDTNTVRERCMSGYYETSDELGKTFSVAQNIIRCGSSVQRGKMDCMN